MKKNRVIVEPYNPVWPDAFQKIRQELISALADFVLDIVHVGSTSVPGLAAKPIIDLDVIISDNCPVDSIIQELHKLGYEHEGDLGIPGREAFRYEDKPHLQKHHLYVCRESSRELNRHITFRNYLRNHPNVAAEYGSVKSEAASLHPDSIDGYMNYKEECIHRIYVECGLEE